MIEEKLNKNDHLVFQLYIASKSKSIMTRRIVLTLFIPVMWIISAIVLRDQFGELFVSVLYILCIIWLICYPIWSHFVYIRHYKKHLKIYFTEKNERMFSLEIENGELIEKDEGTEVRVKLKEIEKIVKINGYYFVFLNKGTALVVKSDIEVKEKFIEELSREIEKEIIDEYKWKWL